MFGLYELLAIFSWFSIGYKALFYAVLGIFTNDVSHRIGSTPAFWIAAVGTFIIEILGVINVIAFIGLIITCFWNREIVAWLLVKGTNLQARLATIPQGQKVLSSAGIAYSFTATILRFILSTSYVQPFTSLDGWATLAASCSDRLARAHTVTYTLTTTAIHDPIIEMGGVRAERIVGCWFTIRREIVTQITIYRVKLAQILIQCKQHYPAVSAGIQTMNDNPALFNSMMGGMGIGAGANNQNSAITTANEIGDDTMDMMRDFIQTTEAALPVTASSSSQILSDVAASGTKIVPDVISYVSSKTASKKAQRAAVEAAASAGSASSTSSNSSSADIPEAQKQQLKTMLLNILESQNIKWATLSRSQRAMYVRKFDGMLKNSGTDFKGLNIGEILGS